MGAWGTGIFDNDDAVDWAYGLEEGGLAYIEAALATAMDDAYLESHAGAEALAAAETLARMLGRGGEQSVYTEGVDRWAEGAEPAPADVVQRARAAIDRVLESELQELWAEAGPDELAAWTAAVMNLSRRLAG